MFDVKKMYRMKLRPGVVVLLLCRVLLALFSFC